MKSNRIIMLIELCDSKRNWEDSDVQPASADT